MKTEIDLSALKYNASIIKKRSGTNLCAVVKCNAYGHGDVICADALADYAECFAVADKCEAMRLVQSGIKKEVLILSDVYDGKSYPDNIVFTAFDKNGLDRLSRSGRRFAVKLNTGMNRLGLSCADFRNFAQSSDVRKIHSVYSHIYDVNALNNQYESFVCATENFPVKKHIFASNYVFSDKFPFDYVRAGLALYGYGDVGLKKAMKITANVLKVSRVSAGENVGYGKNVLKESCDVATIDIGYGDGFKRIERGEKRSVFIDDRRCEVLGQICMDLTMIKVPVGVSVGDEVEIIGDNQSAADVAKEWHTNEYEVLVSLGKARSLRKYVK